MTPTTINSEPATETQEFRARFARQIRVVSCAGSGLFALGLALQHVDVLRMPTRSVAVLTGIFLAANALGAQWVPTVPRPRELFYVFQLFWIVVITFTTHYLGGIEFPAGALLYVLAVVNASILASGLPCYVFANLCAAAYATLLTLEHHGAIRYYAHYGSAIPGGVQVLLSVSSWITFNLIAAYIHSTTGLLEESRRRLQSANTLLAKYRSRLEEEVLERTGELETANAALNAKAAALEEKQDELRTFVYTVTHDLKSPLSGIVLRADMILEREASRLSQGARADLERIMRSAERTEDMIRDLLELFRITTTPETPTWVSLETIARRTLEDLAPRIAAKRTRVEIGQLPAIWGQQHKLSHVITNLLDNATKYVPANGGHIAVEAVTENGHAILCIRDNGIGIAPAYQGRIFETFGRVPTAEQLVDGMAVVGSGVGLAIVKQIVEAHGGKVWVESLPGAGSAFFAQIPREPRP